MSRISAKYQLPFFLWLGLTAFFVIKAFMEGDIGLCITEILVFVLILALLKFFMKIIPGNLVDEVYDCGDFLLVKHRGEEDRVALSDIVQVKDWTRMFPPVMTLQLATPGKFGAVISFALRAPRTLNPFSDYPIVASLIARVDGTKSKRVI